MKKVSLCLTNFNRTHEVIRAFEKVLNDDRISEIIISDDCSSEESFSELEKLGWQLFNKDESGKKIHLLRNEQNLGMSRNKAKAIEHATNDYCIIFDSDNIIDTKYIDAVFKRNWFPEVILMPDFARPHFDYRNFREEKIWKFNVQRLSRKPLFDCLMNTCNYFVHRDTYLKTFEYNPYIKGSDTIWFNYLWLKKGYSFLVVPQMEYTHSVHSGSGFMQDADYNFRKADEIKKMMLAL